MSLNLVCCPVTEITMQCSLNGLSVYKWQRKGVLQTLSLLPGIFILSFTFPFVFPFPVCQQQGLATNRKRFDFLLHCSKTTVVVVVCLLCFLPICPGQAGGEELWRVQICHKDTQREAGVWAHGEGNETVRNYNQHPLTWNQPVKSWWREGNPFLCRALGAWC